MLNRIINLFRKPRVVLTKSTILSGTYAEHIVIDVPVGGKFRMENCTVKGWIEFRLHEQP